MTDPTVNAVAEQIRQLPREQLLALSALLLAEIAGAKADQLTRDELRVRAETLAGAARPAGQYGRVVCPVCGRPKQSHALGSHILRQHPDHLAAMEPRKGPRHAG